MNSHSNQFHDKIFARYLELMKQEQEANPLRAQFLGVSYYAKAISDESWCVNGRIHVRMNAGMALTKAQRKNFS